MLGAPQGDGVAYTLFGRDAGGATLTTSYSVPSDALIIHGSDAQADITFGTSMTPDLLGDLIDGNEIHLDGADIEASGRDNHRGTRCDLIERASYRREATRLRTIRIGDSGDIELTANLSDLTGALTNVTIRDGAGLYAQVEEGSSYQSGSVSIEAQNIIGNSKPFPQLFAEGSHRAAVTIEDGVEIRAGDIEIESEAGVVSLSALMSPAAAGITDVGTGVLAKYSQLFTLPLAMQISVARADISIGVEGGSGVTIEADDDVTIESQTHAQATGNASMWENFGDSRFGFAVGFWWADAKSTLTLNDGVTVHSQEGERRADCRNGHQGGGICARIPESRSGDQGRR